MGHWHITLVGLDQEGWTDAAEPWDIPGPWEDGEEILECEAIDLIGHDVWYELEESGRLDELRPFRVRVEYHPDPDEEEYR